MTSSRPMPRKAAGVHAREVGDEIVVVAEATKQAHVLRGVTADLWRGTAKLQLRFAIEPKVAN